MSRNRLYGFVVLSMSVVLLTSGCNSPDQVLTIPASENTAPKSIEAIKDHPQALSAIVRVMVDELKLPAPQGRVYFYSDLGAYQAALMTEYKTHLYWPEGESREIKQARNQLEFDLVKHTLDLARYTGAITIGQKVFVAEGAWAASRVSWQNQIKTLAHELTHVIQFSLTADHVQGLHRWLAEGFAEWVSLKVIDALGATNFFHDHIRQACHKIINFRELNALESWLEPKRSQSLYGPSACAVHYMIVKAGVPAILEYFRLFKDRDNAVKNFVTAFGESSYAFDKELRRQAESTVDLSPLN